MGGNIWMKDGVLILVKSLPGGGEGEQGCGKDWSESKKLR